MKTFKLKLMLCFTLVLLAVTALAVAAGSPVDAFKSFAQSAVEQDWDGMWDGMESSTQQTMSKLAFFMLALGSMDNQELQKRMETDFAHIDGPESEFDKETFGKLMDIVAEMNEAEGEEPMFTIGEVTLVEEKEDRATLSVAGDEGETDEVVMVVENGDWKYFMEDPFSEENVTPDQVVNPDQPEGEASTPREQSQETIRGYFSK